MTENKKQNIESWIKRITDNEMPIFGRTVQEIVSVSQDDKKSATQLSQVVLKDAAMTSRVLKLANSVHYKRGENNFNTISSAITLLGFDTVRSMCLTVALIDGLEQGNSRKHLVREMARSLHAATQARILAIESNDSSPVEVYITTLLYHIGDLAFWCFCNEEEGEQMDKALQQEDITPEKAQREVLGFSLDELSSCLAKAWSLGDLLQQTLEQTDSKDQRVRTVVLSKKLAIASEQGWESGKVVRLTQEIAKLTATDTDSITELMYDGARQAAKDSMAYGAKIVAEIIPQPPQKGIDSDTDKNNARLYPEPDSSLQLKVLRELTKMTAQATNLNSVMEKILEGIHVGVGMDRALFALMSPDRESLSVKQALGDEAGNLQNHFSFALKNQNVEILKLCIQEDQPHWLGDNSPTNHNNKVSEALINVTGTTAFIIAPISVRGKVIGLYYADRCLSKRALNQNSFDDFQFFTQQSNMILNHLTSKN
jgi:HD-like signal output (HDOD) protein